MSLHDHPRAYGAAALTFAFGAGVLITLGFKDLYPDLERRYQDSSASRNRLRRSLRRRKSSGLRSWFNRTTGAGASSSSAARRRGSLSRQSSLVSEPGVRLEDHESDDLFGADDDGNEDEWSILGSSEHKSGGGAVSSLATATTATTSRSGIADGIAGCIGDTPLVRIRSLSEATGCEILAKAEFLNPGGSPKDRVALSVIRAGEAAGVLVPYRGDTIYEGTVGSTGISIATLAVALGYRAHICMPDDQSIEKSRLLQEMGAVVERVPVAPIIDPGHYVNLARRRAKEHAAVHNDGSQGYFADQFETPANAEAHRKSTGPEILRQLSAGQKRHHQSTFASAPPPLNAFVCGAGTSGTLTGVARYLKEDAGLQNQIRVIAADPQGSGLFNLVRNGVLYSSTEKEGTRRRSQVDSIVEGIGMNRMTATLENGLHLIDDAVTVTDTQACHMAHWLVQHDGIFAGSSTAVNCVAAVKTALTLPPGSRVVTIICDSGLRHLSKFYRIIEEMTEQEEAEAKEKHVQLEDDLLAILGVPKRKGIKQSV